MSGEGASSETATTTGEPSESPDANSAPPNWRDVFGYDEPYDNQADAIETAIETGERGGYLVMEGACGTGKTMAALTAAGTLLRETDRYDNVLVVTPVKQQRQQFIEDLRAINERIDDPFDGLALVGKADLCPYERAGAFEESTQEACEELRDHTSGLVAHGDGGGEGDVWWDSARAGELVSSARVDADSWNTLDDNLSVGDHTAPYPTARPTAPDSLAEGDHAPTFCPFEADWYARDKSVPVSFDAGEGNVVTTDELLTGSVPAGTCPHRSMGTLLDDAEVVVGNYTHLFDPRTRALTDGAVDDRTFVIVDEAHRLEGRVREMLSDRVGIHSLRRARNDVQYLRTRAGQSREHRAQVAELLDPHEVGTDSLERVEEFFDEAIDWVDSRVDRYLANEFGNLDRAADDLPETVEIPLRDPEVEERDEFSAWAREAGYSASFCKSLHSVGAAVEDVLGTVAPERSCVCGDVGRLVARWWTRDHASYFREVTLTSTDRDHLEGWERHYTAALFCYDCLPAEDLKERFSNLGGGVLMSATLEPIDVFRECVGLDGVAVEEGDGADEGTEEEAAEPRPVVERTYDLTFPPENRASWVVDAPAFTARNRGPPAEDNGVRETYAYALRELARNPGNVLLCLPSYREAAWAGERLAGALDKPVLVDEPSSDAATEALKREFFAGEGKVLVTSTRGTLTEGVDYDGDKLGTCAVVGVPLVNVASPRIRAVRRAYGAAFDESKAFRYALTVPAVRRARQAIGRVIRGPEEVGVRAFVDERYTPDAPRSVADCLPDAEREEFVTLTPMFVETVVDRFGTEHPEFGG
ncbi:ATP-dependent DNA helicase [Halococcus salsus]|uniref:ATP-dependent DNA helicase n=1 Tax=Halococcus salsus TaxID=2162894 RepID=UPI00135A57E0|nr:ATP-dependent DNA helicase [Halococcus salsus]